MIDIIIATYNRPEIITNLVNEILSKRSPYINKIIVVDSSDEINRCLFNLNNVTYLHSNHKNQPYQRYLGFKYSQADYLLFLDDDMILLDDEIFEKLEISFNDANIVGINLVFTNKNDFLENVARHSYNKVPKWFVRFIHDFTANPNLPDGKLWYCGCRGRRVDNGYSEYFSGGAFCVRRTELYKEFDLSIFTLFEKKIGMGEDVILAYTLSKQGKIFNLPKSYFFHNEPPNSVYTTNDKTYNYRVAYSRLYLSLQYARLNGKGKISAAFITYWHHLWRLVGLGLIFLTNKKAKWSGIKGYFMGVVNSFDMLFKSDENSYWQSEISKNITDGADSI